MEIRAFALSTLSFSPTVLIFLANHPKDVAWCVPAIGFLFFILFSMFMIRKKGEEKHEVISILPSEFIVIPSYLSLMIIAFALEWNVLALIVLVILWLLWLKLERVCYFNIVWLFLGYRFYTIQLKSKNQLHLITKQNDLKMPDSGKPLCIKDCYRINNFTFIQFRN